MSEPLFENMDALIEALKNQPLHTHYLLNLGRFNDVIRTYHSLLPLAKENQAHIIVKPEYHHGYAAIILTADDIIWRQSNSVPSIHLANNMEIYPLANGKIRIALMFYGLTTPIEMEDNK